MKSTIAIIVVLAAICFSLLSIWSLQPTRVAQATAPHAITQLTNDHAIAVRPAWSPDNRMIAYQSNRDGDTFHIYLMNADGTNKRALTKGTTDDRHPVWMPDGKSLVFDSSDGTRREIWKVNVADGSMSQITRLDALANFAAPSPDGRRMAFYLLKDDQLNLWTAQPDGKDAKPLTRDLASANNNQCTFACHQAAWSADSQRIVYSGGDHKTIWMAQSDGTKAQEIIADGEHNHFPWFLTDGRLGYITEHVEAADKAWTAAWAYDFKTGQRTLLQNEMAMQGPFEWSNDSTKVLFHSPRSGKFEIYMIDLKAPGGVDALKGKTILPEQIKNADSVDVTAASEASSLPTSMALLVGAGLLAVFLFVGVGLVVRSRRT